MAPRQTLKLKSISCKGLKFFNLFQKPSIYAAVSLTNPSDRDPLQRHETPVDRDGGENPEWDHPIRFTLDRDRQKDLILRFDLTHQGGLLLGDRIVGEVTVPVANLDAEATPGAVRHVSYQVRSPDGKPNGVLSFTYKIRDPEAGISFWAPPPPMPSSYYYPPPPAPVPAPDPTVYYPAYPPEGGGYYPPPPPGPGHVGYYPPPVPDSYYPGPQEQYGCRTEFPLGWGRSLTGYI